MRDLCLASSAAARGFATAPPAGIFPCYSARVFKEALAVVSLVLAVAVCVMLAGLLASQSFGAPEPAVCERLDTLSLLAPRCSALI